MSRLLPSTLVSLNEIEGVGKVMSEKYGERFVAKINRFRSNHPELQPKLDENMAAESQQFTKNNSIDLSSPGGPGFVVRGPGGVKANLSQFAYKGH